MEERKTGDDMPEFSLCPSSISNEHLGLSREEEDEKNNKKVLDVEKKKKRGD